MKNSLALINTLGELAYPLVIEDSSILFRWN